MYQRETFNIHARKNIGIIETGYSNILEGFERGRFYE